ncbi:glutathione hydrolase 1 proenzyme-like, partial [Physella acuta]|uniref:glutathione hydrolase 1 proenzyme-like n=1 Tax=Physella acuta TaxID=109671 RepID=UPI0027DB0E3F
VKVTIAGLVSLVIATAVVVLVVFVVREQKDSPAESQGYQHASVAADSAQCSTVGKDILQKGGNAVDAAIAALLCTGLTSAQSMGIGGGFFMTIYNRTTRLSTVIDARETAPAKATADMFAGDRSASAVGRLSIAVPGEIKGYWYAHQKYGRLPWSDLFQPAIKMAAEGFPVPIGLHNALKDGETFLTQEPSLKEVFVNKATGKLFKLGEIMKRPQLAQSLRVIANEGMIAFYNGSLTNDIMQDLQDIGSIITREDLINYKVLEKKPVEITIKDGIKVVSPPAPSGGPVLSFILNVLDGYYLTPEDVNTVEKRALNYHRMIETFKFAYAKRTALGDDSFIDIAELIHNLTSRDYADSIRKQISDSRTFDYLYYGPTYYSPATTGTSHLSVLDQDGSAVSVTSTINARFGSQRRGMKTGIIFNDEMDDFSAPNITNEWGIRPSPANFIQPGKRPLSSMCPAIFIDRDGQVSKVLGAAGGSKITTATAWVAAHILWFGDSIKPAVDSPRLHHQLLPPRIEFETGFNSDIVKRFTTFGHNVTEYPTGKSIVQGINVVDSRIYPDSDYRKGGVPAGF